MDGKSAFAIVFGSASTWTIQELAWELGIGVYFVYFFFKKKPFLYFFESVTHA